MSDDKNPTSKKELNPDIPEIIREIESKNPKLLEGVKDKEKLAKELIGVFSQQIEIREIQEHHQGPLPSPSTLNGYNNVVKNGAERIMKVFESQSSHRMNLEKKVVYRQTFQSLLGQILGFVIVVACLGLGVYLVSNGFEAAGIILFSLDIVGLAYVFVVGKKFQEKSLRDKS
ncbi:MAG: DUF2335 domain-containing protein [Bacteroidetes bacterium]|nr:DUF2335 domain-containing protein [Bacteroidota bacterium]